MSLDVRLIGEEKEVECYCSCGHEHTRGETEYLYESNITHNLGSMAEAAGIYKHLWRPEELGITVAEELIKPLTEGLQKLKDNPDHYKQFDASNGWGTYKHFVPWVSEYLEACKKYPKSKISVSR